MSLSLLPPSPLPVPLPSHSYLQQRLPQPQPRHNAKPAAAMSAAGAQLEAGPAQQTHTGTQHNEDVRACGSIPLAAGRVASPSSN